MVLLFVDLLGTKEQFRSGGVLEVKTAFKRFENLVRDALRHSGVTGSVDGVIESDSLALQFADLKSSVNFGVSLYQGAFRSGSVVRRRPVLRGVLVEAQTLGAPMRKPTAMQPPFKEVQMVRLSDALLQAVTLEKSGFKGMRLLVEEPLVTQLTDVTVPVGNPARQVRRVRRLENSVYPDDIWSATAGREPPVARFYDLLWMLPDAIPDQSAWQSEMRRMHDRLRWAGRTKDDAFLQFAATSLVFTECNAIIGSILEPSRIKRRAQWGQTDQG